MDPHTASAIAQVIFYAPAVPVALYICIRNWKNGPRMAWYPAVPFTLIRLTGAILTIVEEKHPGQLGLIIATIVLLNVGLVPMLIAFLGILRLVLNSNFPTSNRAKRFATIVRYQILAAVVLLSVSGGFAGQPSHASTQATLSRVAYIQFACVLVTLVVVALALFRRADLKPSDRIYLKWLLLGSPALCLRTIYGIISVFKATGFNIVTSKWSPLFGSAVAFTLMALLPEYVMLCIYMFLGFNRLHRDNRTSTVSEQRDEQLSRLDPNETADPSKPAEMV